MRKLLFVVLITLMTISPVFAEKQKIGVFGFKKKDSVSAYVQKMLEKLDFKKILANDERYELVDMKDTSKAVKAAGIKNVEAIGETEAIALCNDLGLDFALWGSVSTKSKTEFKIDFRVLANKTKSLSFVEITAGKKNVDRQAIIRAEVIDKLEDFAGGEIERNKQFAAQAYKDKNFKKAKDLYREILKVEPTYIAAYEVIGLIEHKLGNYDVAVAEYSKALEHADDKTIFYKRISQSHIANEDYEAAAETMQTLAETTNLVEDWIKLAELYIQDRNEEGDLAEFDEIIEVLMSAYEIDNNNAIVNKHLGTLYVSNSDYEAALPYLEVASEQLDNDKKLASDLAKAYIRTNKLDSAIDNYKSLIVKHPENEKNYIRLAKAYRTKQEFGNAENTLKDLVKIAPNNVRYLNDLAEIYLLAKKYPKVNETLAKSLEINPDQYNPYLIKGNYNFDLGYLKYQKFNELDAKSREGTVYGADADKLIEERDNVKKQANKFFQNAQKNYKTVKTLTTDSSALRTIKERTTSLNQLLKETESDDF